MDVEFISKKIADIKILHEGYTADYFLNRMKTNALFPILFIQNIFFFNQVQFVSGYCTMCILEKFYRVFCILVLIGQYLSRNWLLDT
jgi:peptidoglycan/LPS O-acetylase OafA/YrhL